MESLELIGGDLNEENEAKNPEKERLSGHFWTTIPICFLRFRLRLFFLLRFRLRALLIVIVTEADSDIRFRLHHYLLLLSASLPLSHCVLSTFFSSPSGMTRTEILYTLKDWNFLRRALIERERESQRRRGKREWWEGWSLKWNQGTKRSNDRKSNDGN